MAPDPFTQALVLIVAYLVGSIPFGLFVSWLFNLGDPRKKGSKNIGATNILRQGSKGAALLTLFLDVLKGSAAVSVALMTAPQLAQYAGMLAVIGHIFPMWLGFRGGKGIATAFGAILLLSWPIAIACLVTWIMVAVTTKYSSLAALLAVILSPLYAAFLMNEKFVLFCIILALLILWTHRENIKRLLSGKESKIGESRPSATPQN